MAAEEEYILEPKGLITLTKMVIELIEHDYDIDKGPASVMAAAGFLVGRDENWDELGLEAIACILVFAIDNWQKIKSDAQEILEETKENCETCEGDGQVVTNTDIESTGPIEIIPCPDCQND